MPLDKDGPSFLATSFRDGHVVGALREKLGKVYEEPKGVVLPRHLAELVRRFEEAESKAVRAAGK